MIEVLGEIVCFATASVSFVYGTLLGLFSGERVYYERKHRMDSKILKGSYPLCFALFSFGFVIINRYFFKENITILLAAFGSALVLSQAVIFYSGTRSNNREGKIHD